jgi:nucleoside-diphosphate-sugar epimerase
MRVLITGASGFIGTALAAALRERGDEVVPSAAHRRARDPVGTSLRATSNRGHWMESMR